VRRFILNKVALFFVILSQITCVCYAEEITEEALQIEADNFYYDKESNRVIASGDVEVKYKENRLTADKILYLKSSEDVIAEGNVALFRRNDIFYAQKMNVKKALNSGMAIHFKARINGSVFSASSVQLFENNDIDMKEPTYTPCKICKTNLISNKPLWQLRASEAHLEREKERVKYKNVRFELYGVPILYVPYVVTPSPHAKRKSGMLPPIVKWSNQFGFNAAFPIYFNIKPNMDMTISPRVTEHLGEVYSGEYRYKFPQGNFTVEGSYTRPLERELQDEQYGEKQSYRGHIKSQAELNYNGTDFGFYLKRVHDNNKTYLKKYGFGEEDVLVNRYYAQRYAKEGYLGVNFLYFQSLNQTIEQKDVPVVLPHIKAYKHGKFDFWDVNYTVMANFHNTHKKKGADNIHATILAELDKDIVTASGHVLDLNLSLRADAYRTKWNKDTDDSELDGVYHDARFSPSLRATWKYPLYGNFGQFGMVISPVLSVIATTDTKSPRFFSNEDSQEFEISGAKVFEANRYLGFDKIEHGSRVNYGIQFNLYHPKFQNVGLRLGQNYRFKRSDDFEPLSGLEQNFSDFVTSMFLQPSNGAFIVNSNRFRKSDMKLMRNDLSGYTKYNKWFAELGYSYAEKDIIKIDTESAPAYNQEASIKMGYNFYNQWWLDAHMRRRFGTKIRVGEESKVSHGATLRYANECIGLEVGFTRDYTEVKDLKPNNVWDFKVSIPNF
jgi:LPS-assembly protein